MQMDFSGRERHRVFASERGTRFEDVSYLSGLDSDRDGRAVAWVDLDHDGDDEIVFVHRNAPLLRIYTRTAPVHSWIAVRLAGDGAGDNRDAVGAAARVRCGGRVHTRHRQIGEGFGVQNSAWLTIALGTCTDIEDVSVTWPSGQQESFGALAKGERYTLRQGTGSGPLP